MKERDYFAGIAIIGAMQNPHEFYEIEAIGRVAYEIADAMEAERLKRFRWPVATGTAVEAGDTTSVVDLSDWPSFSERDQATAKDLSEKLIQDCVPFHVEHSDDVWVFTVLCEDWKTAEEEAYERLGGE